MISSPTNPSVTAETLRETGMEGLAEHFALVRPRLKSMVAYRITNALFSRIDPSDVVQDAFIEANRRLPEYLDHAKVVPFIWLRQVTQQVLTRHFRRHIGIAKRDVTREIKNARFDSIVRAIADSIDGPADQVAKRECHEQILLILKSMREVERDVICLKQFECLTFPEIAQELGITEEAAKKRFYRAVKRLAGLSKHLR